MGKDLTVANNFLSADQEIDKELLLTAEDQEHLGNDEVQTPLLLLAQKQSNAIDSDHQAYIEGLKVGDFYNNVAGKSYGDKLIVQCHGYFRRYGIYEGEEKQSAEFKGSMSVEEFETFQKESGPFDFDKGDQLHNNMRYRDTRSFIITMPGHPEDGIMIMPLSSSGIKAAKSWNTQYNARRVKRYATLWELESKTDTKDGNSFKIIGRIKPLGTPNAELLELGKSLEPMVKELKKKTVSFVSEPTDDVEDSDF